MLVFEYFFFKYQIRWCVISYIKMNTKRILYVSDTIYKNMSHVEATVLAFRV